MAGRRRPSSSRALIGLLAAALFALTGTQASTATTHGGISAEEVVGNLDLPITFTIAPDGRIFYGEQWTGEIHIYDPATSTDTLFATVPDLVILAETGLLGVTLHPQYPAIPAVYAFVTQWVSGTPTNQILVYRDDGGVAVGPTIIFVSDVTAGPHDEGGRILFGPDRLLYAFLGTTGDTGNAQDLTVVAGKMVRMTPRGQVPPTNPIPGSYVISYGHRNSFGFDFDPLTGNLWESENGPNCNDEVNRIVRLGNYGWGSHQTCRTPPAPPENTNQDGPSPIQPLAYYSPTVAPTGLVFCDACGLTGLDGDALFGTYNTAEIHQLVLTADRLDIASDTIAYRHGAPIISMEAGPDGTVYFSTHTGIFKLVQN